ncbi:DNA repair protein RecO [Porphyromonas asaccharolytica]|uniref:DNA repair protein RecO n=1 Tax=Porphyromonas asaccharolytica TaxID=28123 RepID=UPI00248ECAFE|nr:recombination protein O N-terminal domain-containing protein [Porphyromonas asaccharolytica]
MITTVEGIVLRVIPYSDRSLIATLYTDLWGATAFSVPIGGRSRATSNLFQPLRGLQITTPSPASQPVKLIRQVQLVRGVLPLAQRPAASGYFLYLSQLLRELLAQEPEDLHLYNMVAQALEQLDGMETLEKLQGFDLALLVSILRAKGYLPEGLEMRNLDSEIHRTHWLDLEQWTILPLQTDYSVPLTPELQSSLPRLLRYDLEHFAPNSFSTAEYETLRRLLLHFTELHSPSFRIKHIMPLP